MAMPRTTIITGARSGIGHSLAALLSARGEKVVRVDVKDADVTADLGERAQRDGAAARILEQNPAIDAVVACAGVAAPADGGDIVSVNFFGAVDLLAALLPRLQQASAPRAVVISSIATLHPSDAELVELCLRGDEQQARARAGIDSARAYASSKRALTQWVRRVAAGPEWAGKGVLLNGIAPGTVRTNMALPLLESAEGREMLAKAVPIAVADYAEPEEIAPLLAFLSGPDNRFMVGQVPFVDGGTDLILRGDTPL